MKNESEVIIDILYSYALKWDTGFAPNPYGDYCTLACCKNQIRKSIGQKVIENYNNDNINSNNKISNLDEIRPEERKRILDSLNIWVLGIVGNYEIKKENQLDHHSVVYLMKVTDTLTFNEYYRKGIKKPEINENINQKFWEIALEPQRGDNIYEIDEYSVKQLISFHRYLSERLDLENLTHDLSGLYVLLSDYFVYFGSKASEKICFDFDNLTYFDKKKEKVAFKGRTFPVLYKGINDNGIIIKVEQWLENQQKQKGLGRIGQPYHSYFLEES